LAVLLDFSLPPLTFSRKLPAEAMKRTETLPDNLKQELANCIIKNFLANEDIADRMMNLAIDLTEPLINPENHDLFSEVSGMVGYRLAEFFTKAQAQETVPDGFNVGLAEEVLNGDLERLLSAFKWSDTPQGASYWDHRSNGFKPLSDDDIAQIERWIKIAKSQNL
jgi:uncharacterized membrane-anchored protein YjiN (DUF445 family)